MADAGAITTNLGGTYLTIVLGSESGGIALLKIHDIKRLQPITAVPQMPSHIRGALNLRGKIIPVVDLRVKFGFPSAQATDHMQFSALFSLTLPLGVAASRESADMVEPHSAAFAATGNGAGHDKEWPR